MKGIVIRKSGDKTVVVETTYVTAHPLYRKKMVRTRRFLVHDPQNKAQVGQAVEAKLTRPLSARKRWVLVSE